jgi:hypothetical protein
MVLYVKSLKIIKGIVSIILLKKKGGGLERICRKNNHNHLRSNNYDVCTAAALCMLNLLDVMVLENIYYLQTRSRSRCFKH